MMAKDNAFSNYYTNRNLTKAEFYLVADTLYDLNNFWMLSRMLQVMENFQLGGCIVAEDMDLGYTAETRRIKAYAFTTKSGKNVPQIILQGNWVEKWGFEAGCSVTVECYQNKLVILKD